MPTILFTTVGSGSWVKPSGVTRVEIECWGAGGNGGTRTSVGQIVGGGGGGAYSANMSGLTTNYAATEMVVPYYVADAGSGIDTTWGKNSSAPEWNVYNRVRAKSGTNGGISSTGTGGAAGSGDGTTKYSGGNGALGVDSTNYGGGGGGAAGELGNGGNASGLTPGSGNGIYSGTGGQRGVSSPTPYGAGGAGGGPGQVGTAGLIRIQYADPATQFQLNPTDVSFATEAEINPTGDYNLFIKL